MDPLSDVLEVSGVRGALGGVLEAGGVWGVALDDYPGIGVYAVTSGAAWLTVAGGEPLELVRGDVVVVWSGTPHALAGAPGTPTTTLRCRGAGGGRVQLGSSPASTRIVTVHYECATTAVTQLLPGLPGVVHVGAASEAGLDDTVRMLGREVTHPRMATSTVVNSLVDVLLVQVLRAWIATRPDQCLGTWLGAMADPVVARALARLHADPAHGWTTASLASAISVSRATLARRFPATLGQTPAAYLTNWRMDLAAVRLRETDRPVEGIAADVGYTSAPAFGRAFARVHGQTPGRYRTARRRPGA